MASDRRGLVVDDLVLRLLRASAGVVMVALLVSGGTGVAVGGSSPDPRESVHSPPVVDLAENVATDTRTQRADDCRAPLQQPSAVEGDVVCAYDYRPDFARPPPDDAAAYAYDTAANSAEPAGSLGRVRRVLSGLVLDRVAPRTALDDLQAAANRASANVGPGRGAVHGTHVHSSFADELAALGRTDVFSEISYLNGRVVPYGTKGSVRLDAVVGSPGAPSAIYDLKTGSAALTSSRIAQIRSHLPPGFQNIPVHELRPG